MLVRAVLGLQQLKSLGSLPVQASRLACNSDSRVLCYHEACSEAQLWLTLLECESMLSLPVFLTTADAQTVLDYLLRSLEI